MYNDPKNIYFTVTIEDKESGIKNYVIKSNGKELRNQTTNKYVYSKELKSVNVVIYDKALNSINVNCVIKNSTKETEIEQEDDDKDKIIDVKTPPSDYTRKYSASSSSLKINITYKDGIYYSYIWAKNPVKQFSFIYFSI